MTDEPTDKTVIWEEWGLDYVKTLWSDGSMTIEGGSTLDTITDLPPTDGGPVVETTHTPGPVRISRESEDLEVLVDTLVTALEEATASLQVFADRVYNDNGDVTVTLAWRPTTDDYVKAYFAWKKTRSLIKEVRKDAPPGSTRR